MEGMSWKSQAREPLDYLNNHVHGTNKLTSKLVRFQMGPSLKISSLPGTLARRGVAIGTS